MSTTYAVVDIETTGTDPRVDRIIQFGCVLIRNGKIINRFSIDINPLKPISKPIQQLTHISNKRVRKAPYFEDVAASIYNLLADTTFVAHNIHFDYNFLNQELKRCGLPALTIPGIDTVELAQIFLPTQVSFRLGDLAESLHLQHDMPHQADSDAEVTAHLLIYIEKLMQSLPLVTMEKIAALSSVTSKETHLFILKVTAKMKEDPHTLDSELMVIEGIALHKKEIPVFVENHYANKYPESKKEKLKLYDGKLTYRKEQAQLMNSVYRQFTQDRGKNLLIEASTGMGKTLGYLLPLAYLATPENPVVISTVSILLQHQLLHTDIPLLNSLVEQQLSATVVKSKRHYIDLQRFKATLDQPVLQKQYALYQMGILVWLTQTTTGDMDELNLIRLDHILFREIRHRGTEYLLADQAFYQEDFLRHLKNKMKQSNVLIVNHAFLAQETQRTQAVLPESSFMVIDEAHHLAEVMEKVSNRYLDTRAFQKEVNHLFEADQLFEKITEMVKTDENARRTFSLYQTILRAIIEQQECLFEECFLSYPKQEEVIVSLNEPSVAEEKIIKRLLLYYDELLQLHKELNEYLNLEKQNWLKKQLIYFGEFLSFYDEMKQQASFIKDWLQQWHANYVHQLYLYGNRQTAWLQLIDFQAPLLARTTWYDRYQKIIYLGGSLKVPRKRNYYAQKLGIAEAPLKVMPTSYDYSKQARLMVIDDKREIQNMTSDEYAGFLANCLIQLLSALDQPALVLFTSHEILQSVYKKVHSSFMQQGRELLAQGMGGSKEKILKRFVQSKKAILFGADSFWEGVDLPGDSLQLLIISRLPFDNPERPLVACRKRYMKEQQQDFFSNESLPKAALKLRQGLGRLIRSEEDQGVMILLDSRLINKSYGKYLQKALPKELPIQVSSIAEMKTDIQNFLQKG
ncbi:MAG TPA: helicase C-terminal domain-containing protein [Tetragenococcus sp.]|nr:helicase C-terminal domain-containing protein [Tetragenococcus sp.]